MRKAASKMVWLAGLLQLAGCDFFFRLDEIPLPAEGGITADGANVPPTCTARAVNEDFTGTAPACEIFMNNATVTSASGQLSIAPQFVPSDGGCVTPFDLAFADGGVIAQVNHALAGSDVYTMLQTLGGINATMAVDTGILAFETFDASTVWETIPFDPQTMSWWRLRPDRRANAIIAEYSPDGVAWTLFGTMPTSVPTKLRAALVAGVNPNGLFTSNSKALFSRLIVCM